MSKINLEKKWFIFSYSSWVTLCHRGKSGQELKAGSEAEEAVEECAVWWCDPHGLLNLISYTPRITYPSLASTPSELIPPWACLRANLRELVSQLRYPLLRRLLVYVKITKTNQPMW